jgi:hypothetical protein
MAPRAENIWIVTIEHPSMAFAIDVLCEWTSVSVRTPCRLARAHWGHLLDDPLFALRAVLGVYLSAQHSIGSG